MMINKMKSILRHETIVNSYQSVTDIDIDLATLDELLDNLKIVPM